MPTIKVMSAGAVKSVVAALGAEFERESGITIDYNFGTAGALRDRVKGGETADLVIVSESAIAELAKLGHVVAQTVTDLGRTVTGVIVRRGAPSPDIATPDAFKQALRNARSIAYTDPKAGGSGGIMFVALLEKLGMLDEVNAKAVLGKGGFDVSQIVADGRAELGTTFVSEALPVKGLTIVGTLPGELHNANTYTAAVHTKAVDRAGAEAFLSKLIAPPTRGRWTDAGLEPAFPA
jgi:molybdate transport system substrate-binding protein